MDEIQIEDGWEREREKVRGTYKKQKEEEEKKITRNNIRIDNRTREITKQVTCIDRRDNKSVYER